MTQRVETFRPEATTSRGQTMFTAEQQAAIDAMIAKAVEGAEAKAEAVAAKNKELLGELKKARKNSEIDPAEFEALRETNEALETKLAEATKANKTALVKIFTALANSKPIDGEYFTEQEMASLKRANATVRAKVFAALDAGEFETDE